LRSGKRGDQLLDPTGERADLGGQGVNLVQQDPGQLGVVVIEPPGQCPGQGVVFGFHPPAGQACQDLRVALPGDQCPGHVPHRLGVQGAGHAAHLDQSVFQQFSSRA
jgi:hypothetical protein